ncbi:MAG: ribosome small subunit-dependent GTPase A [Planctomycetes bacterium]|nr:ribosome small subunit-dependent GTPase A [Planctomycetota bacterium]
MAKRKGKSQHRRKSWEQLHRSGHLASEDAESRRRLSRRRVKLPGQKQDEAIFADQQAEPAGDGQRVAGTVVLLYPGGAIVRTADHGDLQCGLAGTFRPAPLSSALAVGDEVTLAVMPETRGEIQGGQQDIDGRRVDALILQRAPRRTALSRPQSMRGKRRDPYETEIFEKVIAANMDQLVVIGAVAQPRFRRGLLDRYLIVAERGELPLVLVVNKIDLGDFDHALLDEYVPLGVSYLTCSSRTGEGLDAVRELLTGRRSILAGASGVGKSSLLNALVPELELVTREVRQADQRGRHTTTAATLYDLPFGGSVVDTPGIRELGLEIDKADLPWYFPEIAALAPQCRFRDCSHTHEPDCAVQAAVEAGTVPERRYVSYLRILESIEGGGG